MGLHLVPSASSRPRESLRYLHDCVRRVVDLSKSIQGSDSLREAFGLKWMWSCSDSTEDGVMVACFDFESFVSVSSSMKICLS